MSKLKNSNDLMFVHSDLIPYWWSQSCKSKKIFCILCYLFNININKTPQLIRSWVRADSVSQTFFVPSSQMINLLSTNNRYPPDKAAKCLIVMNDKCSFSLYCTRLLTSSSSCRELLESQWLARDHFTVTRWRWLWVVATAAARRHQNVLITTIDVWRLYQETCVTLSADTMGKHSYFSRNNSLNLLASTEALNSFNFEDMLENIWSFTIHNIHPCHGVPTLQQLSGAQLHNNW